MMIFTSVTKDNLYELSDVFEALLLDHGISFTHVDLQEEDGILSFLFCNDPAKARSVEFEADRCLGLEMDYIANEILGPIIPRLKNIK